MACLLRVAHLHGLAVEVHAAFVGLDRAIDDFHQRGLARAVFAQHGVDLAGCTVSDTPLLATTAG